MTAPRVYRAINAVVGEFAHRGIPKASTHVTEGYQYRSIDDVLDRLSPLLARHRLCILPRVMDRICTERIEASGALLTGVTLKVAYQFVSVLDGSEHTIETYGEALDENDKATAKAMSAAYKTAVLQAFCIPIAGLEDADSSSLRIAHATHKPEPVQGWLQWSKDLEDMVSGCVTREALRRVQFRNRDLLTSISRERPDLYDKIGMAFSNWTASPCNAGKDRPLITEIAIDERPGEEILGETGFETVDA